MSDEIQYKTDYFNPDFDFDGRTLEEAIAKLREGFEPTITFRGKLVQNPDGTPYQKFPEGAKDFRLDVDYSTGYDGESRRDLRIRFERPKTQAELREEEYQQVEQEKRERKQLHDLQFKYGKKRKGEK